MTPRDMIKHAQQGLHALQFCKGEGVPVVRHALESIEKLATMARRDAGERKARMRYTVELKMDTVEYDIEANSAAEAIGKAHLAVCLLDADGKNPIHYTVTYAKAEAEQVNADGLIEEKVMYFLEGEQ